MKATANTRLIDSSQVNSNQCCSFWSRWNCGQKTGSIIIGASGGGLISSLTYVIVIGSSGLATGGIGMAVSALACATGVIIFKCLEPINIVPSDVVPSEEYSEPPDDYSINAY